MNAIIRIIVSLVIAAAVATGYALATSETMPSALLLTAFASVAVICSLLPAASTWEAATAGREPRQQPAENKRPAAPKKQASSATGPREQGTVKWFNASKGFGFIVREDGEEIFVHFRSIRGEGRRSLRDGQSVSFVVADSDKGPQAEDVEGL